MTILVLGLGNILMTDDAVGVRVVERFQQRYRCPEGVTVLDGGTLGLDLLPRLEGVGKLLIVDALEMDGEPGRTYRLEGEDVPRAFANKLSVHQMGVQDLLAVAELQGYCPPELLVWGIQPASVEMSLEMSPPVAAAVDEVVEAIVAELAAWGVQVQSNA